MAVTIVLMGVAGAGKSTVMTALAARLGWDAAEGDDFHSPENVARMRSGVALTDDDRRPWLESVAAWIGEREAANGGAGENAIVTCSALRRSYRDLLRDGHPSVRFVHLVAAATTLEERVRARQGHYMPPALLASQLETLEPLGPDEPGAVVSTDVGPAEVVAAIMELLGSP
jgi:gluconokinase